MKINQRPKIKDQILYGKVAFDEGTASSQKPRSKKEKLFGLIIGLIAGLVVALSIPTSAFAAGVYASGGGSKTVGQTFTVTVRASGAEFDSLQGTINVSGPVDVVSFSAGAATWLPGKSPANGSQFVGIVSPTSSLTVASIKLKGKSTGSGAVSVSGVSLARNGSYVGSEGGSTNYTIGRAPTPPGGVSVSSSTHPDQEQSYEATTVSISWSPPANGASGYSYVWDQSEGTTPDTKINTTDTSATFENQTIGTYYFHIRANNTDGWGGTTHFRVNIKEPDPKIDETLASPSITEVGKTNNFLTDIEKGTVSGVRIKGTGGLSGYIMNLSFDPNDRLPAELSQPVSSGASSDKSVAEQPSATKADSSESTTSDSAATLKTTTPESTAPAETPAEPPALTPLQTYANDDGSWEVTLNYPLPSGFYKLTVQGQQDKILTPVSSPVYLEIGVANGGTVKLITAEDLPKAATDALIVFGVSINRDLAYWLIALAIVLVVLSSAVGWLLWRRKKRI